VPPRMKPSGAIMAVVARDVLAAIVQAKPHLGHIGPIAGVPRALLADQGSIFPLATFTSILEAAATELCDSSFGLSLGQKFHISALGPVGELMLAAPSVGEAIQQFVRYFSLVQTNTKSMLAVSGGVARFSYVITDSTVRCRSQDANFTIAMEYGMLRYMLGDAWRPLGVELAHNPGDRLAAYQRHFTCPLRFEGGQNALTFPAHLLELAPRAADAARYRALEHELAASLSAQTLQLDMQRGLEAWVTASICHALPADVEAVAADFGMSQRSFQRGLKERGLNYAELRNNVRLRMSQSLLAETDMPVTAIGLRLGYSETSAFSRAFHAQAGCSPARYRAAALRTRTA
jgi:AraC-like DNA-binding protein